MLQLLDSVSILGSIRGFFKLKSVESIKNGVIEGGEAIVATTRVRIRRVKYNKAVDTAIGKEAKTTEAIVKDKKAVNTANAGRKIEQKVDS